MKSLMKKLMLLLAFIMICLSIGINAFASDGMTQTIEILDDTFIDASQPDSNFSEATYLSFNNTNNAGYIRQPLLRFDMSSLSVPEGYEIDTAIVEVNILENYIQSEKSMSLYVFGSSDYDAETITWNTEGRPVTTGTAAGTVSVPARGTGWVEIDISSYMRKNPSAASGLQTFVFYPDTADAKNGALNSKESGFPAKLTVTYKPAEAVLETTQTIVVSDDTYIDANQPDNNFSANEQLLFHNNNNASYRRQPMLRFNMNELSVPEGYNINSVKVRLNIAANYMQSEKTISLYKFGSADYDVGTITWNTPNRPESTSTKLGTVTVPARGTGWVEVDITSYIKDNPGELQGMLALTFLPDIADSKNGAVYSKESGFAPEMTVVCVPESVVIESIKNYNGDTESDVIFAGNNQLKALLANEFKTEKSVRLAGVAMSGDICTGVVLGDVTVLNPAETKEVSLSVPVIGGGGEIRVFLAENKADGLYPISNIVKIINTSGWN